MDVFIAPRVSRVGESVTHSLPRSLDGRESSLYSFNELTESAFSSVVVSCYGNHKNIPEQVFKQQMFLFMQPWKAMAKMSAIPVSPGQPSCWHTAAWLSCVPVWFSSACTQAPPISSCSRNSSDWIRSTLVALC